MKPMKLTGRVINVEHKEIHKENSIGEVSKVTMSIGVDDKLTISGSKELLEMFKPKQEFKINIESVQTKLK